MEQVALQLLPTARMAVVLAFVTLALAASLRIRRTDRAGRWVAAAFGSMAVGLLLGWAPDLVGVEPPGWLALVGVLLVLAFPYLLLRFTASFASLPAWLEIGAAVAAGAIVVATVMLLPADANGDEAPGGYLVAVLAYWVVVSLVTVWRLWRAGREQPTVTRRGMRLMAAGAAVLVLALLVAAAGVARVSSLAALVVDLLVLISAGAFGVGFSPPRMVRRAWRQPEEQRLQAATVRVLRARTPEEVAAELLPPTVQLVNGGGAALLDADGHVVASIGDADPVGAEVSVDAEEDTERRMVVPLEAGSGALLVSTGPYSRFFGREDRDLLRSMAAVAGLALERCELLAEERAQRAALEAAQHEAEQAREEANRANTAKSDFLSRMSHELRTPLNAILGFGQLLETAPLTDDDRDGVGHILKAGRHLLALINDVLDLSRIEAGTMTISLEPVHVAELIEDSLALIRPLADERTITIGFDATSCDRYVMTDRQRGRQVLLNLLSNAVKYNHDRGQVEVSCVADGDMMRIFVIDSGPGIDPGRRQHLFEPFERLGAETSGVEGTGLGLALTKQLVERIGGAIGVDSTPRQGSTFWVDLPLTQAPVDHHEPRVASPRDPSTGERTLLLVEDNLANLRVVEAMLRRRPGISVIPAMQGGLAIELAHQHVPDVIVLDLHLPDLTGQQVLHRLRADPKTRHIPVIIASADATPSRMRQLEQIGAYAYITKPLDLHRFLDLVDGALSDGSVAAPDRDALG